MKIIFVAAFVFLLAIFAPTASAKMTASMELEKNIQSCKSQAFEYKENALNTSPLWYTAHWSRVYNKCFAEFVFLINNDYGTFLIYRVSDVGDYEALSYLTLGINTTTGEVTSCTTRGNPNYSLDVGKILPNSKREYEKHRRMYMNS